MIAPGRVNAAFPKRRSVAVILNGADLARARRLRRLPDFFELRLDGFGSAGERFQSTIASLPAPIILTARSSAEGARRDLPLAQRRDLLRRSLSLGAGLDLELLSIAKFYALHDAARAAALMLILSRHDLQTTPPLAQLLDLAANAHSLGASVFKMAARTDRADQVDRLLGLIESAPLPVSAMGFGKLGAESRRLLARAGSVLNYAHLGRASVAGQLSLPQLRRLLGA